VTKVLRKAKKIAGETVRFSDPATVKGIGWPSGGRYPATGVVIYDASRPTFIMAAEIETCAVPTSMSHLCARITSSFVQRHWLLPP
jgi:hypothetical protein